MQQKRPSVPLEGPRAFADRAIKDSPFTMTALSRAIGRNGSYVQQWIRYANPGKLPETERKLLAKALGVPERHLRDNSEEEDGPVENHRPEPELLGNLDLRVFAAVEGGPGEMVVSSDAIDLVRRPWFLERVSEAYAVIVTGESMEPVYEAGDYVLVNPTLPPMRGKDAVFVSEVHGGDFRASIKRYVGSTSDHWIARQFSPPPGQTEEVRFPKSEWVAALRVVGKYVP